MAQSAAHKHDSTRRATYQDVLDAPAHLVAEVLDGTLHTHPRPAMPHGLATLALGTDLSNPFQFGRGGPGGWWIAFEPELHLGEEIVVPDLAGWRRERMPEYPQTAYVHPRARLGVRGALTVHAQARPAPEAPALRPRRGGAPVARRAERPKRRHRASVRKTAVCQTARWTPMAAAIARPSIKPARTLLALQVTIDAREVHSQLM